MLGFKAQGSEKKVLAAVGFKLQVSPGFRV